MANDPDSLVVPLGTVLCPSGRLTLCDWVLAGDWSFKRYPVSALDPDGPRLTIREHQRFCSAAVIDGLRPDVAFPVTGGFTVGGRGSFKKVEISIRDGLAAERVEIGTVDVLHGRMVVADALADLDWDAEASLDGLADVTFWGRHGAEVAAKVGASPVLSPRESGIFGWRDLPLEEADRIARDLETLRSQERAFAVDLRYHTAMWRVLERLRQSSTGSIEIDEAGARSIMFEASHGHHLCFIGADLDEAGNLLRVIVDLARDPFS